MIVDVTIDLAKFCGPRTGLPSRTGLPLREREQLILCMFFKREISQIEALMQLRWNEETWARVLSSLFNQNEATTINVRFPPLFRIAINDGSVVIRQANKAHQCAGGHNGLSWISGTCSSCTFGKTKS
jgi:hypothetical protein